ncbi:MAG: YcjX family protein [Paracoccaceae bacterium]|nr:YcjX family protein [Paracoccaceae bacterium]
MIYATALDGSAPFDEAIARTAADKFHHYLTAAHSAGISDLTPGHFLLSGELTGSPVLTFAHICQPKTGNRKSLWREMERLYDAYKAKVVHPFFQKRFLPYQLSNCIDPSFEHPA